MATTRISPRTIFSSHSRQGSLGFSLFEILIVLGVIAGTMALLIPQIRRSDNGIKKVARHLYVLTKDVRNQARLKNRTFRIVFNMNGEEHSYWVESAAGLVIPKSEEQLEKEESLSEEEKPKSQFQKEEKYTKKTFLVPRDWFIGHIETATRKDPVSSGEGYIYFSPQGLVEPAIIQLTNRKQATWSIVVNSLTGQSDIVDKAIALRDTQSK